MVVHNEGCSLCGVVWAVRWKDIWWEWAGGGDCTSDNNSQFVYIHEWSIGGFNAWQTSHQLPHMDLGLERWPGAPKQISSRPASPVPRHDWWPSLTKDTSNSSQQTHIDSSFFKEGLIFHRAVGPAVTHSMHLHAISYGQSFQGETSPCEPTDMLHGFTLKDYLGYTLI